MKQPMLAGTVVLALAASHPAAQADPIVIDFTYTGRLVTFTVPTRGTYHIVDIVAFGAQGGDATAPGGGAGGRGAEVGGDFSLSPGDNLQIAVGGAGMAGMAGGRGGGGSFVAGAGNIPLIIAGQAEVAASLEAEAYLAKTVSPARTAVPVLARAASAETVAKAVKLVPRRAGRAAVAVGDSSATVVEAIS